MIYDQIPLLLGYGKNVRLETEYLEEWLDPNGLKIIIDEEVTDNYHYLSEEKLTEIIQLNRESMLDFDNDVNFQFEWKVGDMCYFEYKVHFITEMKDDRISGCSDGLGGCGGYLLNDRCFKINPNTLRCSNNVEFYYRWISDKWDNMGGQGWLVNLSDLHNILIDYWIDMINGVEGKSLEFNRFGQSVIDHIDTENYSLMYNDINIFREIGNNIVEPAIIGNEEEVIEETEEIPYYRH